MTYLRLSALPVILIVHLLLVGCGTGQPANSQVPPAKAAASGDYRRGTEALKKGDYALAIACFDLAIRANPGAPKAYIGRGLAYHKTEKWDQAIRDYTEAILLNPKDATTFIWRGLAYSRTGDIDQAIRDYTNAIRLDPKIVRSYLLRAACYLKTHENAKAIQDCTEAIRLDPKNPAAHTDRGMAYAADRQYDQAILNFTEALRINPKYSVACEKLAWLRATCPREGLRDGAQALDCAHQACESPSDSKDAHKLETLAAAHAENKQFAEAVKWQRQALQVQKYQKDEFQEADLRLKLYESGQPYRELDRPPGP